MKYIVTNIDYDTDNVDVDLPKELFIHVDSTGLDNNEIVEIISNEISNITGFCHFGFQSEKL